MGANLYKMTAPVTVEGLISVAQTEVALLLESGYLYMEMQKFREAEEVFVGAAALVPHSEIPSICLGNLFFSQGRYPRALRCFREAAHKNPESALAHAHVGEALLFTPQRDEARAALEKAMALDPKGEAGAFAKSLLEGAAAGVV